MRIIRMSVGRVYVVRFLGAETRMRATGFGEDILGDYVLMVPESAAVDASSVCVRPEWVLRPVNAA